MACPYYREPESDELIGSCNNNPTKIPSEVHQDCLCRSDSETYAGFCPIYTKLQWGKSHKRGILKRILMSGHKTP